MALETIACTSFSSSRRTARLPFPAPLAPDIAPSSGLAELDDHLDVVRLAFSARRKFSGLLAAGQTREPARSARAEHLASRYQWRLLALTLPTMTLFGAPSPTRRRPPAGRSCGRRCRPRSGRRCRPRTRLIESTMTCADAGALDDHVGLEAERRAPRRRGRSRRARARAPAWARRRRGRARGRRGPRCLPSSAASRPIGPAPVTSTLRGSQVGALADPPDLLPRLGDHRRRFEQHAEQARGPRSTFIAYSGSIRQRSRHEAVDLLDAALGVAAVAAHVPFADRAGWAGHRVGAPDDADDQVAGGERAGRARVATRPSDSCPRTSRRVRAAPSRTCPRRSRRRCRTRRPRSLRPARRRRAGRARGHPRDGRCRPASARP